MKIIRTTPLFALLLLISCKPDEPQPINIVVNGDMEAGSSTPTGWTYYSGTTAVVGVWTDKVSRSPSKSLHTSAVVATASYTGLWFLQKCGDIPHGKTLVLKAMVKGNLLGAGASVALRGDDDDLSTPSADQFASTQDNTPITGSFDWKEYRVEFTKVEQSISCLRIFLIYLPNTSGDVYFDNVSLEYN